jgi:hypothetical protein
MKVIKILTITALLSTFSMAQKEALILGISDYMGTQSDLAGVKKDVPRMEKLFKSWGFNVTILQDAQSMSLESHLANYANLRAEDNFIFYYSGHGFHVKDVNGDEPDGEDEALVLSSGAENKLFLDDALFGYLNAIKAKKMVLLDSCHSGTAFKAFGDKPKPKSITSNQVSGVMRTKSFRPQQSKIAGEYIVFSAAKDKEESLDTSNGGLFTNAFLSQIKNGGASNALMNMRQKMENEIVQYCKRSDSIPHHPKLSASTNRLKYSTINQFFTPKAQPVPTKNIVLMGGKSFRSGELLDFKIDTLGNTGYITIFSIENDTPFIMYKSQTPIKGVFNFKDFKIQPQIECYKACTNCASEQSVAYVAFSAQPITIKFNRASKTIDTPPIRNTKALQHQKVQSFKIIIRKFKTIIY